MCASVFLRSKQASLQICKSIKQTEHAWKILGWHSPNQLTPPWRQGEEGCSWALYSRKSHIMTQLSLPQRCQPICGLVAVWIRTVAPPPTDSHTLRLKMCLLDVRYVWLSRLELWSLFHVSSNIKIQAQLRKKRIILYVQNSAEDYVFINADWKNEYF